MCKLGSLSKSLPPTVDTSVQAALPPEGELPPHDNAAAQALHQPCHVYGAFCAEKDYKAAEGH